MHKLYLLLVLGQNNLQLLEYFLDVSLLYSLKYQFYASGSLHCEALDTIQAHLYQIFRGFFTVFSYGMVPFVGICISKLLIII
jgi:hypothetical protein